MNVTPTPSEAHKLAAELLPNLVLTCPCLISEGEHHKFHKAAKFAGSALERPATPATCQEIGDALAVMFTLVLECPRNHGRSREEVRVILECLDFAGSACTAAGLPPLH